MWPILISLGPFHIFSFSVFLILSWLVFSFIFWSQLRSLGVEDDPIFDLTFYATIGAIIFARLAFVTFHLEVFSNNLLKIPAIWVQPGLSLYGALVGAMIVMLPLAKTYKIRAAYLFDALAFSLPGAILVGKIGSLLDGAEVGKLTTSPWAVSYIGYIGKRHPVQIYEILMLSVLLVILWLYNKRSQTKRLSYGRLGIWFFFFYSLTMFILEFFKDSPVYFITLSANQLVLIALWGESVGVLYVRGGGKDFLHKFGKKLYLYLQLASRLVYAKFPKRHA